MKKVLVIGVKILAVVLSLAVVLAFVLVFPLFGKDHVQVWGVSEQFDIAKIESVEKKPGEEFKILQLTDIQLWTNLSDNKKALKMVTDLVDKTKPDLIVLTGDNVSGITSNYLVRQLIKVMDATKTPWAPVFGNHDSEGKATLNWQGDRFEESEYCLFSKGPSNLYGSGNYVVNITENGKVIESLMMLDNGRYYNYGEAGKKEVYMGYEQMAWYQWNIEGIAASAGKTVPSMVFSHVAMPEMKAALEQHAVLDEATGVYTVPEEYGFGSCAYLPGVAPVNSGFFDLCKKLGSTHAIFCGHDHENDASITYEGITMTYGLKAGPSPAPWNNATRYGGTMITIGNETQQYATSIEHIVAEEVAAK